MEPAQATLRRTLIAHVLRCCRRDHGLTLREAAVVLGRHPSALSRIETGQRSIRPRELGELLAEYAAPDAEREVLLRLAHPGPPQWLGGDARLLPQPVVEYLAVEQVATELLIWAPCLVPDLLQVPPYTRSVLTADPGCDDSLAATRAVMARQTAFSENAALMLDVVIGEAALRQQVASPAVMTAQLEALAVAGEQPPSAAMHVMPFTAGEHPLAGCGPFTIVRFGGAPRLTVVHLAGPAGGTCLTGPEAAGRYLRAFQLAKSSALSSPRSAAFLRELGAEAR